MHSNIYNKINKLFNTDPYYIAKSYNYEEINLLILKEDINELKLKYPKIFNLMQNCDHRKDSRTSLMFYQDLICSWIFEDSIVKNLKKLGLDIQLNGECSQRKFIQDKNVNCDSDFLIKHKNKIVHLELVQDYTGFWKKNGVCDLRDNRLISLNNTTNSYLLCIDMVNKKFNILNVLTLKETAIYLNKHPIYKKPAYRIHLNYQNFKNLNWDILYENIIQIMEEI